MASAKPGLVSMQAYRGGLAGAIACRPYSTCALRLHRVSPSLLLVASASSRFSTRILCSASPRPCINVASIHALDPEFYQIPYEDGIPVGKRLKLWNLPPNCKHGELLEWFSGVDVVVESLELTTDPVLNAQGIGGFVEFATKQHACIAVIRLDGYKFRGHYIRMDFAERRPRPNYGSRRSRSNQNNSSKRSYATSSRLPARNMVTSDVDTSSSNAQFTPSYDAAINSTIQASTDLGGSIPNMGPQSSSSGVAVIQHSLADESAQSSPVYGTALAYTHNDVFTQSSTGQGSNSSNLNFGGSQVPTSSRSVEASPGPGTVVEAPTDGVARLSISGVEEPVSVIGQVPSSPHYASHKQWNPSDDPFKVYGTPDHTVVEPWSNNVSFRSGPMYGSPEPSNFNRLFVGNMAPSVDNATLRQLFSRFGTVLEATVLSDPESGRSRGFGVVAMASAQDVKAAFEALDGWCFDNRPLIVETVALHR